MDILRRELNAIYAAQRLEEEVLDPEAVAEAVRGLASLAQMTNGMAVITDAACDRCYMQAGAVGELLGLAHALPAEYGSSDEDLIYNRIHPEDLAEKRMLEYEYFKYADRLPPAVKTKAKATCRLRMRDRGGRYVYIDNSTGLMRLSPGLLSQSAPCSRMRPFWSRKVRQPVLRSTITDAESVNSSTPAGVLSTR